MNRIVLIGNGFDLAHGLKTSYKSFIDWYWKDWGEKLLHGLNKTETDGFCTSILNLGHKNCLSIKPYYYIKEDGTDNYLDIIQNISRNFTDMKLMRDRVVNKTYCEPLT